MKKNSAIRPNTHCLGLTLHLHKGYVVRGSLFSGHVIGGLGGSADLQKILESIEKKLGNKWFDSDKAAKFLSNLQL